jgi:hypothetical protein
MGGSGDKQRSSALIADEMTRAGWVQWRNVLARAAGVARLLRLDALLASKNNVPPAMSRAPSCISLSSQVGAACRRASAG